MSEPGLTEPRPEWLPLGLAVFRLGVVKADSDAAPYAVELYQSPSAGAIRLDLEELLKRGSGANSVLMDFDFGEVRFLFENERKLEGVVGTPWTMIDEAGTVFEAAGINTSRESMADRFDRSHKAMSWVWYRYLVPGFARAVETKSVIVFARLGGVSAPFNQLPNDTWNALTVLDWKSGTAQDASGRHYFSIHVSGSSSNAAALNGGVDETEAIAALCAQFKQNPDIKRADARDWLRQAGFRISDRAFQSQVWPEARVRAGLTRKATPGRRKKSSQ